MNNFRTLGFSTGLESRGRVVERHREVPAKDGDISAHLYSVENANFLIGRASAVPGQNPNGVFDKKQTLEEILAQLELPA
jgi:hypothetical protein